jgi:hypothetical protein
VRAPESRRDGRARAAERPGGPARLQVLPVNEEEKLAITLGEPGERRNKLLAAFFQIRHIRQAHTGETLGDRILAV